MTNILDKSFPLEPAEEDVFTTYCSDLRSRYTPNRNVLFIQLPQMNLKSFSREIAEKKGYYAFPPTGQQYLFESIKDFGMNVKILDLNLELLKQTRDNRTFDVKDWITILEDELARFDPSVVSVSCMFDAGIHSLIEVLQTIKTKDRAVSIAGGVIPTYEWRYLLENNLSHFVVKRDGEDKIRYLMKTLMNLQLSAPAHSGICFKNGEKFFETRGIMESRAPDTDLVDSYSLVQIENYYQYGSLNPFSRMAGLDKVPFSAIQMNRGCRGNCTFCSVRDFVGKKVYTRNPEKVLAEMQYLVENKGVRHFEWLDDDLLFNRKNIEHVLSTIIQKKWNITWSANNGLIAAALDEKLLDLIDKSGCIGFKIGIESGNDEILKQTRKPGTKEDFLRTAALLNKFPNVFVGGNFMLGFPQEKFSQMMDSFRFFLKLNLDWGAFTICQAIRGANAFREFEDYFETQILSGGEDVSNFIPARESRQGEITTDDNIRKGLDIFQISPDVIPTHDQIKEIWFTFNLVGNFINNKNLQPGGNPEKFVAWVEMAQVAYPTNPKMSLFLGMAHCLLGNHEKCRRYYENARHFSENAYWVARFKEFGLEKVLDNPPMTKNAVFDTIGMLRKQVNVY